ncbi:MAG TPA: zinc-dependent alcohol dehydrogenase family protein [Gemmatimonadales bacterium]|nr:zinc-dependent alcohol dehydrogenase family protein [Gemmatimonadales bacterium]
MILRRPGAALTEEQLPRPAVAPGDVLLQVLACGVCRTDLHILDGELDRPTLPLVLGHEIIGRVLEVGREVTGLAVGDRVGVPWLGGTCGECQWCRSGRENLCDRATFTGYTRDGGYAELAVARAAFCFPIPKDYADAEAAPLLCAGLIGYRAYTLAGDARRLGLYGFGAAAHLLAQLARSEGHEVYAFVRPGDEAGRRFAVELGAAWAGDSDQLPPEPLDAAIIFAPVGALVPAALRAVTKTGTVVCAGIHMSDIPAFPYKLLWEERQVRSVANLTRADGQAWFRAIARHRVHSRPQRYPLAQANQALADLRAGKVTGAAVLIPGQGG